MSDFPIVQKTSLICLQSVSKQPETFNYIILLVSGEI